MRVLETVKYTAFMLHGMRRMRPLCTYIYFRVTTKIRTMNTRLN